MRLTLISLLSCLCQVWRRLHDNPAALHALAGALSSGLLPQTRFPRHRAEGEASERSAIPAALSRVLPRLRL